MALPVQGSSALKRGSYLVEQVVRITLHLPACFLTAQTTQSLAEKQIHRLRILCIEGKVKQLGQPQLSYYVNYAR